MKTIHRQCKAIPVYLITLGVLLSLSGFAEPAQSSSVPSAELKALVWNTIQAPDDAAFRAGLKDLKARSKSWTWEQLEKAIRLGPVFTANAPQGIQDVAHTADYNDWASSYFAYIPTTYAPEKPAPLLVIMNGGNSNMTDAKARMIAKHYLEPWVALAEQQGWMLMSPAAAKGWGVTGYALALSAVNDLKKTYNINPDLVCGWGQSMGGHACWRLSFYAPDRFAGLSPVCGGHGSWADSLTLTNNLALYQVWGEQDPHSAGLAAHNRALAKKLTELRYDHKIVPKQGGHELFEDTFPDILEFFSSHPRNLYPQKVIAYTGLADVTAPDGGPGQEAITWKKPMPWTKRWYWLECAAKIKEDAGAPMTAERTGPNAFTVTATNVKQFILYLHDKMIDFSKPVTVAVNGRPAVSFIPERSLDVLFENVRTYNDRGRIYFGKLTVDVPAPAP